MARKKIILSSDEIAFDAVSGDVVGTLSATGLTPPLTWSVVQNVRFRIAGGDQLVRSNRGTLKTGIPEIVVVRVTDAQGRIFER